MKDDIRLLVHLVILFIITLTGAFISIASSHAKVANEKTMTTEIISEPTEINELAIRGKSLFKAKCASCHNINMKSDMTGPALSGAFGRWDNDLSKMTEFIRNPDVYLETKADKRLKDLSKKLTVLCNLFPTSPKMKWRLSLNLVKQGTKRRARMFCLICSNSFSYINHLSAAYHVMCGCSQS